jgi:nicotinamide N-methyltransferase
VLTRLLSTETEDAREQAQIELLKMQKAMDSLEQEREAMMDEIRNVISGAGAGEDGEFDMSRFDMYGQANRLARPSSPNGSHHSATPSQVAESIMRHRTAAEARISEGRGSRAASRNGHEARGKEGSQDGERKGADGSSQVHHFPDDQMNQEIQARTNVVTDQISRIQQQLESTLTNLEGRRSGTYERSERRRDRRTSNASISSMRYEYGIPSSIGHGGMASESESHYRAPSSVGGGGGGGGMTTDDDNYSDMDYAMESARKREKRLARQERREKRLAAGPSAYKAVTPSASSGNLSQAAATPPSSSGIEPAQAASSPLPTGTPTRPPPRERKPSNPWKQQSSAPTPKDSPEFISAPGTPGSHAGDTSNPAIDATPGLGAQSNGHAANGKDVDATPRQQVKA